MKIVSRFLKFIFVLILGVSLSYLLTACKNEIIDAPLSEVNSDILTQSPIVRITSNNYDEQSLQSTFWNTEIHSRFTESYQNSYSITLKESILNYMRDEIERTGEDEQEFTECFNAIGEFKDGRCLPCLVESAKYDGKYVFIFVFNWGVAEGDLDHIAYYAVEKSTKIILKSASCR